MRAGVILLQLFQLRCLSCSFVENIFSFIMLSIFVIMAGLRFFSANSAHRSSLGRFPFLLRMGQFFLFLCMSSNFGLYPGWCESHVVEIVFYFVPVQTIGF